MDDVTARACALWTELAGVQVEFGSPAGVVVAPGSLLCPPGWAGIVRIGDAAVVTAPDVRGAQAMREAAGKLSCAELVDPARLSEALSGRAPVLDVLGPAALFYLERDGFVPGSPGRVEKGDSAPAALLAAVGTADADESGLGEITSPAFLLREGEDVVAAAGYLVWPRAVAHLCVLVAPHRRRRGLAGIVASAAVSHALGAGLLPQWRARPYASRRVAAGLGFRELGTQLSVRM
ncbi:GNAT family N-acetyltransferase [Streptomyces sp. NBC_01716]|uniref:GNAT family N-acetyltransferase n=1 Tax=Streptomyces sp. NBC_01716 TaxID=2975917 RepID=UPI002E30E6E2|nr:GNAT family N-acetyltransferase [Streptomyces sp. NBC_01716]